MDYLNIALTVAENTMAALGMMGKGMLGIFVVIGVIAIIVTLLTKITSGKKDK